MPLKVIWQATAKDQRCSCQRNLLVSCSHAHPAVMRCSGCARCQKSQCTPGTTCVQAWGGWLQASGAGLGTPTSLNSMQHANKSTCIQHIQNQALTVNQFKSRHAKCVSLPPAPPDRMADGCPWLGSLLGGWGGGGSRFVPDEWLPSLRAREGLSRVNRYGGSDKALFDAEWSLRVVREHPTWCVALDKGRAGA